MLIFNYFFDYTCDIPLNIPWACSIVLLSPPCGSMKNAGCIAKETATFKFALQLRLMLLRLKDDCWVGYISNTVMLIFIYIFLYIWRIAAQFLFPKYMYIWMPDTVLQKMKSRSNIGICICMSMYMLNIIEWNKVKYGIFMQITWFKLFYAHVLCASASYTGFALSYILVHRLELMGFCFSFALPFQAVWGWKVTWLISFEQIISNILFLQTQWAALLSLQLFSKKP